MERGFDHPADEASAPLLKPGGEPGVDGCTAVRLASPEGFLYPARSPDPALGIDGRQRFLSEAKPPPRKYANHGEAQPLRNAIGPSPNSVKPVSCVSC